MEDIIIIRLPDPNGDTFRKIIEAVGIGEKDAPHINNAEFVFPGLKINMSTGIVEQDGRRIQLNNSEFRVLCHLVQHPGRIFTKDQLYMAIYGEPCYNTNTMPTTIWSLRKKLGRDSQMIKTMVGFGYKFEIPTE